MTTTSTFSGMDLDKPSSKVLAPPGGKSNVFFGSPDVNQGQQTRQKQTPQQNTQAPTSQPEYSSKTAKPQGSFNLLTGEPTTPKQVGGGKAQQGNSPKPDPANMPAAGGRLGERQVTRKNPPGGASSISFGGY